MISLSTRFLAQPREMRLTLIMTCPTADLRGQKSRGEWPRPNGGAIPSGLGGLGDLGHFGLSGTHLQALLVGEATLLLDPFVVLLAHGMELGGTGCSQARPGSQARRAPGAIPMRR